MGPVFGTTKPTTVRNTDLLFWSRFICCVMLLFILRSFITCMNFTSNNPPVCAHTVNVNTNLIISCVFCHYISCNHFIDRRKQARLISAYTKQVPIYIDWLIDWLIGFNSKYLAKGCSSILEYRQTITTTYTNRNYNKHITKEPTKTTINGNTK